MRAKDFGVRVVTGIDSIKTSETWMDGFEVMPMQETA
jgi:adenosylhomocysteinase